MPVQRIIVPELLNLNSGNKIIVQGSDNFFRFQIKDIDGVVIDLTTVDPPTDIYSEFRNTQLGVAGNTTAGCPIPRWYVEPGTDGYLWLHLTKKETNFGIATVLSGWYDLELIFEGYKSRPFFGQWKIDGKQVTTKLSI